MNKRVGQLNKKLDRLINLQNRSTNLQESKIKKPVSQEEVLRPGYDPVPGIKQKATDSPKVRQPEVNEKRLKPEQFEPSKQKPSPGILSQLNNPEKKDPPEPPKPPKPGFMERNPDLEKFIGENLLSKIGIVIFVIGMGFLVKLGVDSGIINESMRVGIGILIGGLMIGLAHRLRNTFAKFSSILIGGALSVLYFTIALAFHEYELIPQAAAFIIMIIITAFGVLLSLSYDRKILAILAMIGGFGTPFFLSTGSGNITVLFSYILILDIGMLMLVYFKKWNIINYLTYGFTYLLFIGVYFTKHLDQVEETRGTLLLFLTLFYTVFFLMNIIYNVKNNRKFKFSEISMLLSNSAIYFGFGLSLVQSYKNGMYSGLFTALVAVFNFIFTFILYKRKNIDRNLLYLLIGLVLTFVSLIAPIQLEGNYITLFWSVEAVLLLWLYKKSKIDLMNLAAFIVTILMLISLFMDWQQNYYPKMDYVVLTPFLNKAFITTLVSLISFAISIPLLRSNNEIKVGSLKFHWYSYHNKIIFVAVLYLGLLLELNYQFVDNNLRDSLRSILLGIYNYLFVLILLLLERKKNNEHFRRFNFTASALVVITYLFLFPSVVASAREIYLNSEINDASGFLWHYALLLLFIFILIRSFLLVKKDFLLHSAIGRMALWALAFIGVYLSSIEIGHLSVIYQGGLSTSSHAYEVAVKSVYPIIWAVVALILMIIGMKYRLKTLRIASLVLFSITILKLFIYDLAGNSTGKIISFILLGAILLLISFLYQKLKFIIQDDDKENKET